MLTRKDLFAKALLVEKHWFVHEIKFDPNAGKLEIWIDFERGSSFYYEDIELGIKGHFKACDTTEKTWRHFNRSTKLLRLPFKFLFLFYDSMLISINSPFKINHPSDHLFIFRPHFQVIHQVKRRFIRLSRVIGLTSDSDFSSLSSNSLSSK